VKLRASHAESSALLQARKVDSEVLQARKADSERERLLRERDKEVRILNQRLSAVEKTITKRDAELKKRDAEILKQRELLEQRETELSAKKQQMEELRASMECRTESVPMDGRMEVVVRHAIQETEMKVVVSQDATFQDVKRAIAEHLGSDEVLKKGRLLRKHRGAYTAYSDSAAVGSVRSLLVLGINIQSTARSSTGSSTGELQARVMELQADNAKRDSVLRKALSELKRLREEKEAGFRCAQQDASSRPETQPSSKAAAPGTEAARTASGKPVVSSLWRTLLGSRAELQEKEECGSCEPATELGSGGCSDECDSIGAGTAFSAQASGNEPCSASFTGEMRAASVAGESSSVISVIQGSADEISVDQASEQGSSLPGSSVGPHSVGDAGSNHNRMNVFAAKLAAQRAKKAQARMAKSAARDALAARMIQASLADDFAASSAMQPAQHQHCDLRSRMRPIRRQIPIGSGVEPMWMLDSTWY